MASTIARIAAKPVTFPLRSPANPVPTEPKPILIQLDADPRFAAGAGGAVHYLAENAGLQHEAAIELQSATVNICTIVFSALRAVHPHLDIRLTQFADRIEIAISHEDQGEQAPGLDAMAKTSGKALAGVDRVQLEHLGNSSVIRLTKYLVHH